MDKKRITNLFSVLQFCYFTLSFITDGVYASFLKSLGYTESFIGATLVFTSFAGMVLLPVSGFLADRLSKYRLLIPVSFLLMGGLVPFVSIFSNSKFLIYAYAVAGGGFTKVLSGLLDSWVTKLAGEGNGIDFGKIRSIGSISYAVMAVLLGRVFDSVGYSAAAYISVAVVIIGAVCSLFIPNPSAEEITSRPKLAETAKYLMGNKKYLIFVFCLMLMNVTTQSFFAFFAILVEDAGGTVATLGKAYFIMAGIEFIVVRAHSKLADKFGEEKIAGFGMIGNFAKNMLYSLASSPMHVYLCSVSQAFSFSLIVPASPVYQQKIVDRKYLATAQLICQTCCTSIVPFLLSSTYGNMAENLGTASMLRFFSFFALAGGTVFLISLKRGKTGKEQGEKYT